MTDVLKTSFDASEQVADALDVLAEHFDLPKLPAYPASRVSRVSKQARIVMRNCRGERVQYYVGEWGTKDSIAQWFYYLGDLVRAGAAPEKRPHLSGSEERVERMTVVRGRVLTSLAAAVVAAIALAAVAWGTSQWTRHVVRQEITIAAKKADEENLPPRMFGYETSFVRELLTTQMGKRQVALYKLRVATRDKNAAGSDDTTQIRKIWKEHDKDVEETETQVGSSS